MDYNNSMLFGPDQAATPDWADYRQRARAGVHGINQMPGVLSHYAGLAQMKPEDILRLLFPQAGDNARIGLAGGRPYQRQGLPAASNQPSPTAEELGALKQILMLNQGGADTPFYGGS